MARAYKVVAEDYGSFIAHQRNETGRPYVPGTSLGRADSLRGLYAWVRLEDALGYQDMLERNWSGRPSLRVVELRHRPRDVLHGVPDGHVVLARCAVLRDVTADEYLPLLAERVRAETRRRPDDAVHGDPHWRAVAATGLDLAEHEDADRELVLLFGLLHDARPGVGHGKLAAAYARDLHADDTLHLGRARLEVLCDALDGHSDGAVTDDPTVGCAWDSDRIHLERLGLPVDPVRLSTATAKRGLDGLAVTAARYRADPPTWASLMTRISRRR